MKIDISHINEVAIFKEKKNLISIEGWEPYKFERIGEDFLVTGGPSRVLTRGPRKGEKTWRGSIKSQVLVSKKDIECYFAK